MKTILASAYAINPYKGSEDGMGWNFVLQIARFNKVIAVTRENNREAIERFMKEHPRTEYEQITFLYYDLPPYLRFWKRGAKGAMFYYLLWQKGLIRFVKQKGVEFDVVHNLNFHNDWTPSYLWKLEKPMVWGPIGHHPVIPSTLMKYNKFKDNFKDQLIWSIKNFFWQNSRALKRTVERSEHIICMNSSVPRLFDLKASKFSIIPSVASEDLGCKSLETNKFSVLSVGRFVPLKGFDLTLKAFAKFLYHIPKDQKVLCELNLVGKGPLEAELKKMAKQLGISAYVNFIPWMDRSELLKLYAESKVFLFPSHEGAGMVVSEAMSFGVPVVCLQNVGPGEFVNEKSGVAVPIGTYEDTVKNLGNAVLNIYENEDLRLSMSKGARKRFEQNFNWDVRGGQLQNIYAAL